MINHRSRAAYRRYLNEEEAAHSSIKHKERRYEQRKRAYGDYLYFQDREKFEIDFADWLAAHPGTERVVVEAPTRIKQPHSPVLGLDGTEEI